jgi:hypothetical protein
MIIFRLLLVAIIAVSLGSLVPLLSPGFAGASPLADGVYRFDFDGGKQTVDGKSSPTQSHSSSIAIRSACPPSGCVATAWDLSIGPTWLQPPYEGKLVFREIKDQWVGTRWKMYTCNNTINQGSETLAFQVMPDGTFVGVSTDLQSPCAPMVTPFSAMRVGDILPNVEVADPNIA